MPLVFPPAPATFFNRMREPQQMTKNLNEENPGLRHYPLNQGRSDKMQGRGAVPVEPLTRSSPMKMPHKIAPMQHMFQTPNTPQKTPPMGKPAPTRPMPTQMPAPARPMPTQMPAPTRPMPMQMPSMQQVPKMPQPQEMTPQKAAEQFRRMNKGLPDGVRYEPLDDETMRILQQKSFGSMMQIQASQGSQVPQASQLQSSGTHTPMISSQPPASSTNTPMIPLPLSAPPVHAPIIPPPSSAPPVHTPIIPPVTEAVPLKILPSESAEILKSLAQDERNAHVFYNHFAKNKSFAILAKDSKARLDQYTSLITKHFNQSFAPKETEINTEMETSEAIALALSEENKGLSTLGNLLELTADTAAEKQLLRILIKKIISYTEVLSLTSFSINDLI